jgi:DNA-binding transcriptional LysR family regulator
MNLQQLRYARAISECGSFVEAAKKCAVTQPTLSNGLAQLEADLGQALFARTTRSVRLTEFGRLVLPSIVDVLNAQAALVAKAKSLSHPSRQLIRIGVSPILSAKMVEMIVETFRISNPEVDVIFREINLSEMLRLLEIGQLEFVFGPVDPDAKTYNGWHSMQFHEEPLVFVGKAKASSVATVSIRDIADETFIMVPDTCGLSRVTRSMFRAHGISLKEYAGEAMSYSILQEWAQLGIGTAILPASKANSDGNATIASSDGGEILKIAYQVCWRNDSSENSATKQFAAYLQLASTSIAAGLYAEASIGGVGAKP